jgi:hypothetical protein
MSWRRVLPEKLTVAQLLIQFPVFYTTCQIITISTTASLTPSHPIPLAHPPTFLVKTPPPPPQKNPNNTFSFPTVQLFAVAVYVDNQTQLTLLDTVAIGLITDMQTYKPQSGSAFIP